MVRPAEKHIVIYDPQRLPRPEATIGMADCSSLIVKALKEGNHHARLLQARLRDNTKAAKPEVWPEGALLPINPELQLAVPNTAYRWLEAFHDLRWRGKPDHQISPTH